MEGKKAELETLIVENGGHLVALCGKTTTYIISEEVCSAAGIVCDTCM